jgi:hypothetical protein
VDVYIFIFYIFRLTTRYYIAPNTRMINKRNGRKLYKLYLSKPWTHIGRMEVYENHPLVISARFTPIVRFIVLIEHETGRASEPIRNFCRTEKSLAPYRVFEPCSLVIMPTELSGIPVMSLGVSQSLFAAESFWFWKSRRIPHQKHGDNVNWTLQNAFMLVWSRGKLH